mgnify:CR=1 FL=1
MSTDGWRTSADQAIRSNKYLFLRTLGAVLGAGLHTVLHGSSVICATDDVIANTREVTNTAAADSDDGVLLKVVFFAGGTGHPYFSTDTGVVLRAIEMEADVILLAKAIDGVYDSDPKVNPDAVKYDEISLDEVLSKKLGVIDLTATIMCLENKMPLVIFGLEEENSIVNTMSGNFNGTYVTV